MKTKIQTYLGHLTRNPNDDEIIEKIIAGVDSLDREEVDTELLQKFTVTRAQLLEQGKAETALKIIDLELKLHDDRDIRTDLCYEKGRILDDELLDQDGAEEALNEVLEINEDHQGAQERLESISMKKKNWEAIAEKYLEQATSGESKQLTTSLYASAAELYKKNKPGAEEVETYLKKSLEIDPLNAKAYQHLTRHLTENEKWEELHSIQQSRAEAAEDNETKIYALLDAAYTQKNYLEDEDGALETYSTVLELDPDNKRALNELVEAYTEKENWEALIGIYKNSLQSKERESDIGVYIQIGMLAWKKLGNLEEAQPYFKRVLKNDPAQPMALNFFREYYKGIDDYKSLLSMLRNAQHKTDDKDLKVELGEEMARLAEDKLEDPERAVDLWKAVARTKPDYEEAKTALKRLYKKTEKWNALLEIIKEDVEKLSDDQIEEKVILLLDIVEIYEKLRVDVMVLNTYNSILELQPNNQEVMEALAEKYESSGRVNDLIKVLHQQAEITDDKEKKKSILRRIAELWSERVGNHTKAIEPLEEILELDPTDRDALNQLRKIYERRRNWRGLLDLYKRELETVPDSEKPEMLRSMAELAQKRLGDPKTAIAMWNGVLEILPQDEEAVTALMHLYGREKRWMALAEVTELRLQTLDDPQKRLTTMESLGVLWSDRIGGTKRAIEVWQEVLKLKPGHNKAIRVLRDLYAEAGDWQSLEELFAESQNWQEFVDTLHRAADKTKNKEMKIKLFFKIADVWKQQMQKPDRAVKAYERVLGVEPENLEAAKELVPIYIQGNKWPRLLTTYEILLRHAEEIDEKLSLLRSIWELCEQKLGSKVDAFHWCAKAYEIAPQAEGLEEELERLAGEAHAGKELVEIYKKRVEKAESEDERVRLNRRMANITFHDLNKPEDAKGFYENILEKHPEDAESLDALEQIFSVTKDWENLLKIYQKRAELEDDTEKKLSFLFKAGSIEEDKLENLEGAATVYRAIVELQPESMRALRSLERINEAREDWSGLVETLESQLKLAESSNERVDLLYRLGSLLENKLSKKEEALDHYAEALTIDPLHRQTVSALESNLEEGSQFRVRTASILVPYYEKTESWEELAKGLEILRDATEEEGERLELLKRLSSIYGRKLGDVEGALATCVRIFDDEPGDEENRETLRELARIDGEWGKIVEKYEEALGEADGNLKRDLAWELATIYDEALHRPEEARQYYEHVLSIDETHEETFEALRRILQEMGDYKALRDLLHRRMEILVEVEEKKALLFQVCNLDEDVLGDTEQAVSSYKEILEIDPGNPRAFSALERLYAGREEWEKLEKLLETELGYTEEPARIADLQFRRGELMAQKLENPEGAVEIFSEALALVPGHPKTVEALRGLLDNSRLRQQVAGILEPLYTDSQDWSSLVEILEVRLEARSDDPVGAVDLLARIAEIQSNRMNDKDGAFATWRRALKLQPGDGRVRDALDGIINEFGMWEEAANVYQEGLKAVDEADLPLKSQFTLDLAKLFEEKILDPDRSAYWYRQLLELDPANLEMSRMAARALTRLYESSADWENLVKILRLEVDWTDDLELRKEHLFRIAEIQEQYLNNPEDAVQTFNSISELDPEDTRALDSLERLYLRAEKWSELVGILRRRTEVTMDGDERRKLWSRIAMLQEDALEDTDEAIRAWSTLLDENPDDLEAIRSLSRLYESSSRWRDLYDMLDRELMLTEEEEPQISLTYRIGKILHRKLDDAERAVDRYRSVLEKNSEHEAARGALEELLSDDLLAMRAAEILEPIYTAEADWAKLCDIYALKAQNTADPAEKVSLYVRTAEIKETGLDKPEEAFESYGKALKEAVGLPELNDVMSALERLAEENERWKDLVVLYRGVANDILDLRIQEKMRLTVADVARHRLEDKEIAREFYREVLESAPDNIRALDALESLYAEMEDYEPLLGILRTRADLELEDQKARRNYLSRAAILCDDVLDRPEDAISLWEQVLNVSPGDRQASDALEKLYSKGERWHDLAELLERRFEFVEDIEEAVALRFRLGKICSEELGNQDRALINFRAALGGDPRHEETVERIEQFLDDEDRKGDAAAILEPIYASRQNWPRLIEIYKIRRDTVVNLDDKPTFTRRIAILYEEQMEDLEQAFIWYGHLFVENPEEPGIRGQLTRLAGILDKWEDLANVYSEYLDGVYEETDISIAVATELAQIFDERLEKITKAKECYIRVLSHDRTRKDVFESLERMLNRAERWEDLLEVYREASDHAVDMDVRKSLLFKICQIYEEPLEQPEEAILAYRSILDLGDNDPRAIKALERLLSQEEKWTDLVELCHREMDASIGDDDMVRLKLKLGEVYWSKLSDLPAAIDAYEEVLRLDPANEAAISALERIIVEEEYTFRVAQILEPIYEKLGEWKKLIAIYEAELQFMDDKLRRVEILSSIAKLHDERGNDLSMAFDALSRAWLEDVADPEVMQALEDMAGRLGDWDALVKVLEKGVENTFDPELQAKVWGKVAKVYEGAIGNIEKAVEAYNKLLEVRDDSETAILALEKLLPNLNRYEDLIPILTKKAEMAEDSLESVEVYYKMAEIQETVLENVDDAIATWRQVLILNDEDELALTALERLLSAKEAWLELTEILNRRIELVDEPEAKRDYYFKLANVQEEKMGEAFEAITAYRRVTDLFPQDKEALIALNRLFSKEKLWADLLDVLDRLIALEEEPSARNDLNYRAGRIMQTEMSDFDGSIARYKGVLDNDPGHSDARTALEELAKSDTAREAAFKVLEPLLRSGGEWKTLKELYELRIASELEPERRTAFFVALADINETGLGDKKEAFEAYGKAFAEDPGNESVQAQLERLANEEDMWGRMAELYSGQLENIYDTVLGHGVSLTLARIFENALDDDENALKYLRKALEFQPDDMNTLREVDRLLVKTEHWEDLAEILQREVDALDDPSAAAATFYRLGELRRDRFNDIDGAIRAFNDVLARVPDHEAALASLEGLLEDEARMVRVLDILEPAYENLGAPEKLLFLTRKRLSLAEDPFDRARLLERVADLAENGLSRPEEAMQAIGEALKANPVEPRYADEIERLADLTGEWRVACMMTNSLIEETEDETVIKDLGIRTARWYVDRLADMDTAEALYKKVLAVEETNADALDALEAIYRANAETESLMTILSKKAELIFDMEEKKKVLKEMADIAENTLNNTSEAAKAWKAIFDLDESDRLAQDSLVRLYELSESWEALVEALQNKSRFVDDPEELINLKHRVGEILLHKIEDTERAIDAFKDALDHNPADEEAMDALESIHASREEWNEVQDILLRRMTNAQTDQERVPIFIRLAVLAEEKFENIEEAVSYWLQIKNADPQNEQAYKKLEALFTAEERWFDLADTYQQHADLHSNLGESEKEVAYLVKASHIWESKLESPEKAIEMLERILEQEPGNVAALNGLARIYEAQENWEECRKVLAQAAASGPTGRDGAELYFRQGQVASKLGEEDEALEYYQQALELDDSHPEVIAILEEKAREREDWKTVTKLVHTKAKYAEDEKDQLEYLCELGKLCSEKLGDPEMGVPFLEQALEIEPENPNVLQPLADIYFAAGRDEDAEKLYVGLVDALSKERRNKALGPLHYRLGALAERRNDKEQAMQHYDQSYRMDTTFAPTLISLGRLYMEEEQWDKARRIYRSMLLQNIDEKETGVSKADIYYHLGFIHHKSGEDRKAKNMLQRGLELNKEHEQIKALLEQLG